MKKLYSATLAGLLAFSTLFANVSFATGKEETRNSQGIVDQKIERLLSAPKAKKNNKNAENFATDELIVKYKKGANLDEPLKKHGLQVKKKVKGKDIALIKINDKKQSVNNMVKTLKGEKSILHVQPNYKYYSEGLANDQYSEELWGLHNIGQVINGQKGKADVDINIPEAWDLVKDKELKEIIVAVIDTGTDIDHPDLKDRIWVNEIEANGTDGIDDDNNGYVDDIHGWDFYNGDNTVYDEVDGDEHGTHVSGTIAASIDNEIGVAGIAPNAKIMPLKFLGPDGGSTFDAIEAIEYAKSMGVRISNNSWGGYGGQANDALETAIANSDMLFIAAAGNESNNNDLNPAYPASYNSSNILSVAAVDNLGNKASFSNYGKAAVDIAAPGVSILSTVPHQQPVTIPAFGAAIEVDNGHYKAIVNGFGFENFSDVNERKDAFLKAISFLGANQTTKILLVDDDESEVGLPSYLSVYQELLKSLGLPFTTKTVSQIQNGPSLSYLNQFNLVIWFTGNGYGPPYEYALTSNDIASLDAYVHNGGNLLLSGQDTLWGNEESTLVSDTLGIHWEGEFFSSNVEGLDETIYQGAQYNVKSVEFADFLSSSNASISKVNLIYPERLFNFNDYEYFNGTSMAAPHVTGAAALALGVNNKFSPEQVINLIKVTGKTVTGASQTASGKMVDAKKLVESITPVKLEVSNLYDSSQYVKGISESNAKVNIKVEGKLLAYGTADKAGTFNIKLPSKQAPATELNIEAVLGIRMSSPLNIIVDHDDVKPELLEPLQATNIKTTIEGAISEEAAIKITLNNKTYNGKTDSSGKFKVTVGKQLEGTQGEIEITDLANPANTTIEEFTVKDGIAPKIKKVNPIYNTSSYIEGEVSEQALLTIYTSPDNKNWSRLNEEPINTNEQNKFMYELPEKLAKALKIKIVATDKDQNVSKDYLSTVIPDKKAPTMIEPKNLELDDSGAKKLTGKLDEQGTVELKIEKNIMGEPVETSKDGSFEMELPPLKANSKITFVLKDIEGNKAEKTLLVKDVTRPVIDKETISTVYNTTRLITGLVSEKAIITAYAGGKAIATATSDNEGQFKITLRNRLADGVNVELKAKDYAKPKSLESESVILTVAEDMSTPELLEITIADNTTSVTGKVSEEAMLQLLVGDTLLNKKAVATDVSGNFKISIPKQQKGTEVTVVVIDYANNKLEEKVLVADKTPPAIVKVDPFYHITSTALTGKSSESSTVKIFKVGKDGKPAGELIAVGATGPAGEFKIPIVEVLEVGIKLAILAEDEAGNQSSAKIISVLKDTVGPTLVVEPIFDNMQVISGTLNEKGMVKVLVGSQEMAYVETSAENNEFEAALSNPLPSGTKITLIAEDILGNKKTYYQYVKKSPEVTLNAVREID